MFFFPARQPAYIAVLGDIKRSRTYADREGIQRSLGAVLDEISKQYSAYIVSKFTITLGDEFQALLNLDAPVMQIIATIQNELHPVAIRFGIGLGEIHTAINPDLAIGADGPAYYNARSGIDYLKENEKKKKVAASDIRFVCDEKKILFMDAINTILLLMYTIKRSWSERQRQILSQALLFPDTQANIANKLYINQSSVQRSMATGDFYSYKEALRVVNGLIAAVGVDDV